MPKKPQKTPEKAKKKRTLPEAAKATQFQKGNPGGGRTKPPSVMKQVKNLTATEFAEFANIIIRGRSGDLVGVATNPEASVIEKMVAAVASEVIYSGDMNKLDKLLDRMMGKVPDNLNVSGAGSLVRVQVTLPSNGREAKKE